RLVAGAVEQRDGLAPGGAAEFGDRFGIGVELLLVFPAEFGPLTLFVVEPLAQRVRRRDLLEPAIDRRLLHPARPQPVDQDAQAVALIGGFVDALGPEFHRDLITETGEERSQPSLIRRNRSRWRHPHAPRRDAGSKASCRSSRDPGRGRVW